MSKSPYTALSSIGVRPVRLFYFLAKILKKKVWPPFYFPFAVCAVVVNDFVPACTMIGFMVLLFLLTAYGIFVCRADLKPSLLYAALTTEIMLLCYGIMKSLLGLLCLLMPAVFHDTVGVAFMLASEAAPFIPQRKCSRCF